MLRIAHPRATSSAVRGLNQLLGSQTGRRYPAHGRLIPVIKLKQAMGKSFLNGAPKSLLGTSRVVPHKTICYTRLKAVIIPPMRYYQIQYVLALFFYDDL
jgi:hypothetical protein